MIDAGDLSAHQYPPGDRDEFELIRQYHAMQKHRREQVYNVPGNHDAPYYDHGAGSWFQKWGDPLGRHTEVSAAALVVPGPCRAWPLSCLDWRIHHAPIIMFEFLPQPEVCR